ncbi:hypothetical protein I302_106751 [Kwoniella bestiolae CBS 10118]|uniref:Retinoic acid induced 16-like protein-domain-containing protein n=1 Tax=Kwoniella bestiolae CBS 10118 TaxID=1296100 RepID=A0A1B9G0H4_9TREE|nr:hypothetical protein I302_05983 [Kwoniella bestiolae CBS 10118]OCF24523.1 hypothetical protein I302_05983 [Kwoniella bestiolae CBS 10118]
MEVSNFFARLLQPPKEAKAVSQPDDLGQFDLAWQGIKETLEQPDERQIIRGISSTQVPNQLRHMVDALVYESNRTDEDTTGACLEYFLKNDLLAQLERLCEPDRPHGIKAEVLRAINNLIVSLSERFLVHNAVHRPLRRLLRSCVGEEPEEKVDGGARVLGAAGMSPDMERRGGTDEIEEDLVGLMCTLASRMVAYPPLLLIFFHDKGWLQPHPSRVSTPLERALSPAPSAHTGISGPSSKITTIHHFEFLLFSYLLRFVHREGQIGDPARAGLLFLFDIAFLPPSEIFSGSPNLNDKEGSDPLQDARDALGEFILDGDFAEVMAAGLGAIYSLLPSKLHVPSLAEIAEQEREMGGSNSGGMYLGAGRELPDREIPSSTDQEVRDQLDLILKLFGFLQDIIHRCTSAIRHTHNDQDCHEISTTHMLGNAISEATLDAIQSSFLDNVLYPSVLECSSHDGSSVAVLTYLDVLLSNLDDGPLLNRLLAFLMDTGSSELGHTAQDRKKNKRKTGAMGFIDQPIYTADYFADEGRFTLKDLIFDNLHSSEPTSSTAALRLLRTLLGDHCGQSVKGLLSVVRDPAATALAKRPIPSPLDTMDTFLPVPVNSTDVHLQEVELYSSLVTRLDPSLSSAEMAAGYAVYLTDMTALIEADSCFRSAQIPTTFLGETEKNILRLEMTEEPIQHRLNPSDPLIKNILSTFSKFLANTPDQNVAMTGVVSAIALCPNRSLAGWLLYDIKPESDPWKAKSTRPKDSLSDYDSDSDDSDYDIDRPLQPGSDPFSTRSSVPLPAIYQISREIIKTISSYRSSVEPFERLLAERRQGLLFADHLDEAMNLMLDVEPSSFGLPETPRPQTKKRPSAAGLVGGIKSFLTPKKKTPASTPNRSSSSGLTPTLGSMLRTPNKSPTPNAEQGGRLATPIKVDELDMINPSPFRSHYQQTDVDLQVDSAEQTISTGPWSNTTQSIPLEHEGVGDGATFEEDARHEMDEGDTRRKQEDGPKKVSLNTILDNCVILEEFIKELVAIITARRAMGIDQVGFV